MFRTSASTLGVLRFFMVLYSYYKYPNTIFNYISPIPSATFLIHFFSSFRSFDAIQRVYREKSTELREKELRLNYICTGCFKKSFTTLKAYCTGCFKKSFTTLKAYRNLYRGHTRRFELSKCSKTHRVLPRIVIRNCYTIPFMHVVL